MVVVGWVDGWEIGDRLGGMSVDGWKNSMDARAWGAEISGFQPLVGSM